MGDIRRLVPVGFKHHKEPQEGMPTWDPKILVGNIIDAEYESAERQLGTLGGGNHFIEIQEGDDGYIYVMIHSGSRNLGLKVANHYNKYAVERNEEWFSSVPKNWQLAFLPLFSNMGRAYISEMNYCVRFAHANRLLMMDRVEEAFKNHIDVNFYSSDLVNIAHNYAQMENHFGKNVMVHRKGATSAYKDELGIIPGSQGTASYIVRGKGNPDSFASCSHGAGRILGRKQAQKDLVLEDEIKRLDDLGVVHGIRGKNQLDEAPGAYKDIDTVMEHQKNLVEIVRKLKPLAVVKG
jgi:tRNA-splicing ligase RtcB